MLDLTPNLLSSLRPTLTQSVDLFPRFLTEAPQRRSDGKRMTTILLILLLAEDLIDPSRWMITEPVYLQLSFVSTSRGSWDIEARLAAPS